MSDAVAEQPLRLRGLLSAALDAAGLPTVSAGRTSAEDRSDLGLPEVAKVCLVLVDGLGLRQLTERGGHAPFLRSRLADAGVLTTTFPSTTATAITALGTGELAGATGMLGYSLADPTAPAGRSRAFSLIDWEGTAVSPREWQRRDTLAEQLARAAGTRTTEAVVNIAPARFVGSGLTECALRGMRTVSAETLAERVEAAAVALRRPEVRAAYLYWGEVDHVGHHHGWGSAQWGDAVEAADRELAALARRLPAGTLLLITADHGMVDVSARLDVASLPALAAGVALVAGEGRAAHVYAEEGGAAQVEERWRTELAGRATILTRAELADSGLVGRSVERLDAAGDLVVVPHGRDVVVDSRSQKPGMVGLVGVHGGLSEAETQVPLMAEVTG